MPDASPFDPATGLPVGTPLDAELEVTPVATRARLDAGDVVLLDCREQREWELTRIDGAELVPLSALTRQTLADLAARLKAEARPAIVYCRSGKRSLDLVDALAAQGVATCRSMAGGILAWNTAIEPGGPLY